MRHGAVIVRAGSVLGMGVNKNKNIPANINDEMAHLCGDHAEVAALKRVKNPAGATLYVARLSAPKRNTRGTKIIGPAEPVMSKPCKNCQEAIDKAGITRVVWTA